MRPLIGIPPSLDDRGAWRRDRDYHYVHDAYARAVAAAGALPVYLPIQPDPAAVIERLDGLLLPGGDDLPPPEPLPDAAGLTRVPEVQLAFDRQLLDAALGRRLPVLAICYGMQLLCLASGGRLHYHLPTGRPQGDPHRLPEPDDRHPVEIEPGSRLAAALGDAPQEVNSLHHQGVADAGELRVVARAADGLIEAVEADEGFCIGVQWHPEMLAGPHCDRLFAALAEACASP